MRAVIVSHTHWDREWYRTFQSFRARLVDAVDYVLELMEGDPGYHFVLDGQTIVLEDYLEVRPERRKDLERAIHSGRLAIGPWYVQPDSLIPAGETHLRNLLEGRRVGSAIGPVSRVAYTPDSFGHPAQFPQLFRGAGLDGFVYWRGNAEEIEELGANYRWVAPDGTSMLACHLSFGYFSASGLARDPERGAGLLAELGSKLARFATSDRVLFMNGSDHMAPDAATGAVAEALARDTGWQVERGLLEAYVDGIATDELPEFRGELVGGRLANLLPGVWSTRTPLKLANRRCETLLSGWAEPFVALARAAGGRDERPALRSAWRWLLPNQAHDSICGCSQDRVHDQMAYRFDMAEELAHETTNRLLEELTGLAPPRYTPVTDTPTLAVFNPSPHPRTDVVRFTLEPWPGFLPQTDERPGIHPLLLANLEPAGYEADGVPVRFVPSERPGLPVLGGDDVPTYELELVCRDVPAFGWKAVELRRTERRAEDDVDDGRDIRAGDVAVAANGDGTLDVTIGARRFPGLFGLEDTGDRGDTYDYDPVTAGAELATESVAVERRRHASGVQELRVVRRLAVPRALEADREARGYERVPCQLETLARVAPGLDRIDVSVRFTNAARDHRLRLCFPTGDRVDEFLAATTFDVTRRKPGARSAERWRHPAPTTFPQQGFVTANGLTVAAPGLVEAEVTEDGVIALTLLRSVGRLSRGTLRTRPQAAGPPVPTPGAQCLETVEARVALFADALPRDAQAFELGLRAVVAAGPEATPLVASGRALVELEPDTLVLSALKPAEDGDGLVLRVLNPTDEAAPARVRFGLPLREATPVRLDEEATGPARALDGALEFPVGPHALASFRLR